MSPTEGFPTSDSMVPIIVRHDPHGATLQHPWGKGAALRDHANPFHMAEDLRHLENGVMDKVSFISGYQFHQDPVRIVVHDKKGEVKAIRHSHNLRTNGGGRWMGLMLAGGTTLDSDSGTGGGVSYTATSLTDTGKAWATNKWVGYTLAVAGTTFSFISANTGTGLTLDRFYTPGSAGGAAAATPGAGASYQILPGQAPAAYMALTNDATQTVDTAQTSLTAEIASNGLARALGTVAFTAPSSTAGTTNQLTYTLAHTWTATGAQSCQRAAIFAHGANGPLLFFATFTAATLASADTITVTWTITA